MEHEIQNSLPLKGKATGRRACSGTNGRWPKGKAMAVGCEAFILKGRFFLTLSPILNLNSRKSAQMFNIIRYHNHSIHNSSSTN